MAQLILFIVLVWMGSTVLAGETTPGWALPVPGDKKENIPGKKFTLPGSKLALTQSEIDDKYNAPVWFPDKHAAMPAIVKNGNGSDIWACAMCHLASGAGHPQSARLMGFDVPYFVRQIAAFRSGKRQSYAGPFIDKLHIMTDADARQAATWFAGLPVTRVHKVTETDEVPQTRFVNFMRVRANSEENKTEPIAGRIIEVPEDEVAVNSRDPYALILTYVPTGSIAKGKQFVENSDPAVRCSTCHGPGLTGTAIAPNIAGLFSTYIVRQFYDFNNNKRVDQSGFMNQLSATMTPDQIVAVAAYLGSLPEN